jgi:hypothetical protein
MQFSQVFLNLYIVFEDFGSENYRNEALKRGLLVTPTNVSPCVILEGEDYSLKDCNK